MSRYDYTSIGVHVIEVSYTVTTTLSREDMIYWIVNIRVKDISCNDGFTHGKYVQ